MGTKREHLFFHIRLNGGQSYSEIHIIQYNNICLHFDSIKFYLFFIRFMFSPIRFIGFSRSFRRFSVSAFKCRRTAFVFSVFLFDSAILNGQSGVASVCRASPILSPVRKFFLFAEFLAHIHKYRVSFLTPHEGKCWSQQRLL